MGSMLLYYNGPIYLYWNLLSWKLIVRYGTLFCSRVQSQLVTFSLFITQDNLLDLLFKNNTTRQKLNQADPRSPFWNSRDDSDTSSYSCSRFRLEINTLNEMNAVAYVSKCINEHKSKKLPFKYRIASAILWPGNSSLTDAIAFSVSCAENNDSMWRINAYGLLDFISQYSSHIWIVLV